MNLYKTGTAGESFDLGPLMTFVYEVTNQMPSALKGESISQFEEIRLKHNNFSSMNHLEISNDLFKQPSEVIYEINSF